MAPPPAFSSSLSTQSQAANAASGILSCWLAISSLEILIVGPVVAEFFHLQQGRSHIPIVSAPAPAQFAKYSPKQPRSFLLHRARHLHCLERWPGTQPGKQRAAMSSSQGSVTFHICFFSRSIEGCASIAIPWLCTLEGYLHNGLG